MDRSRKCFRSPSSGRCAIAAVIVTYMGLCGLMCVLAETGLLLNNQSFECGRSEEEASRLHKQASLLYWNAGLNAVIFCLALVVLWIKDAQWLFVIITALSMVLLMVFVTISAQTAGNEREETKAFKERYLALAPLNNVSEKTQNNMTDGDCTIISNVHRWQAEYKCCGLEGYEDWGSAFPDSCLCGEKDSSSGCVEAGNSLVYMKPCFPTVLSLVAKHSSTFWVVMVIWIALTGVPITLSIASWQICPYVYKIPKCMRSGGEKLVPVVFIRKDNNNETQDEEEEGKKAKDGEVKEMEITSNGVVVEVEEGTTVQGEGGEMEEVERPNAITMIPLSLLQRLQEELEPPPVQHLVQCLCIEPSQPKKFYTVWIEESSPLLPSNAVLADAKKTMDCFYCKGPHIFVLDHIVWPQETKHGRIF